MGADKVTDTEFDTHVVPTATENWISAHPEIIDSTSADGLTTYLARDFTDAEEAEIIEWAAYLRNSYDTGETPISWR